MKSELKAAKALEILRPDGGWVIVGDDFDSIFYDEGVEPITKKQFDDAMEIAEQTNASEIKANAEAKAALLDRLGISEDEARLLIN
jgi:predicted Ser/Thr protein kinase